MSACNNHQASTSTDVIDTSTVHNPKKVVDSSLYIQDDSEVFPTTIDTIVLEHIDQNTSKDTAFIQAFNAKSQTVNISFSSGLPTLTHANGFGGYLLTLEDFNADGINEILYFPDWFQSNWAGYFIYTLSNNQWQLMAEGTCTRDAVSGARSPIKFLKSRVKKIHTNTIQLIDHEMGEDGNIDEVTREVKF
jgi:hypothetical protein